MNLHTTRRHAAAVIATLIVLAALPAGAAADTAINHIGNTGTHALVDTPEYPGATCTYTGAGLNLTSIRVRWPHVEGYNWTSGSDNQKVGWRFRILRSPNPTGGPYTTVYSSPIATAFTLDNKAATWPSRTYGFGGNAPVGYYTADVVMYWYHPNSGAQTGSSRHRANWYREVYGAMAVTDSTPCPHSD